MKRLSAAILALMLTVCCISALADTAVVTIDGVRTAFFDDSGAYLPPLERSGVWYVPVLSLAESLQLPVTADPDTLAVTVNGIRTAFFDADGTYLPPLNENGVVYVPLVAFAESTSIPLTVDGSTYALTRSAYAQATAAQATAMPVVVAQPVEVDLYGYVPVTLMNYDDYFSFYQGYAAPHGAPDTYKVTYTLTVRPSTSYDLVNVELRANNYGRISISTNGETKVSYSRSIYRYDYYPATEYVSAIGDLLMHAADPIVITEAKGTIRMGKAEAAEANEKLYAEAVSWLSLASTSVSYDAIISAFSGLAGMDYKDSASQLTAAKEKQKELKQQEDQAAKEAEEKEKADDYKAALDAIDAHDFDLAFSLLEALSEAGYRDSDLQLANAQEKKALWEAEQEENRLAGQYQQALDAQAAGDYDTAIALFAKLMNQQYRDSAERHAEAAGLAAEALEARRAADYQAAEDALAAADYETAIAAFTSLSAENYRDSASRLSEATDAKEISGIQGLIDQGQFSKARNKMLEKKLDGKYKSLFDLCTFRIAANMSKPNSQGNVWYALTMRHPSYSLISPNGELLVADVDMVQKSRRDENGNIFVTKRYTGEYGNNEDALRFVGKYALTYYNEKACLVDREGNEIALSNKYYYRCVASDNLLCYLDRKNYSYGCTDLKGKVVIKPAYNNSFSFTNGYAQVSKKEKNVLAYYYINEKGKVLNTKKYDYARALSGTMAAVGKLDQATGIYSIGIIDWSGKVLQKIGTYNGTKEEFDLIRQSGDYLILTLAGKVGVTDLSFQPVLPFAYDYIHKIVAGQCVIVSNRAKKLYSLYDLNGSLLTGDQQFTDMLADESSGSIVARNAKDMAWYILDLNGNVTY